MVKGGLMPLKSLSVLKTGCPQLLVVFARIKKPIRYLYGLAIALYPLFMTASPKFRTWSGIQRAAPMLAMKPNLNTPKNLKGGHIKLYL